MNARRAAAREAFQARPLDRQGGFLHRGHTRWSWAVTAAVVAAGLALSSFVWLGTGSWDYFVGSTPATATVLGPSESAKKVVQPLDLNGDGAADTTTERLDLADEVPVGTSIPVHAYESGRLALSDDGWLTFWAFWLIFPLLAGIPAAIAVLVMRESHEGAGLAYETLLRQFQRAEDAKRGLGRRPWLFAPSLLVAAHSRSRGWRLLPLPWHLNAQIADVAVENPQLPRWARSLAIRTRKGVRDSAALSGWLTVRDVDFLLREAVRGHGVDSGPALALICTADAVRPRSLPRVEALLARRARAGRLVPEDYRVFAALMRHGYPTEAVAMARWVFGKAIPMQVLAEMLAEDSFPVAELTVLAHDPSVNDPDVLRQVAAHPATPDDDATVAALRAL